MTHSYEDVEKKLQKIFNDRLSLDFGSEESKNQKFFSPPLSLMPRDLVYIYFDVEREFETTIPEDDVVAGKFNTFNNILKILTES